MDNNYHHVVAIDEDGQYTEICDCLDHAIAYSLAMIDADEELKDCEGLTIVVSEIFICEA